MTSGRRGATRRYLGHRDEAAPVSGWAAEALGAVVAVHEADAAETGRLAPVAETFSARHRVDGDLGSGVRAAHLERLELLRDLELDVLAPWAAGASDPPAAHTGRADARRRIDAIIARLRAGGSR